MEFVAHIDWGEWSSALNPTLEIQINFQSRNTSHVIF